MPTPDYIEIPLTQGQVTRVSAHRIQTHPKLLLKWRAVWMPLAQAFYAARHDHGPDGKRYVLYMHRYLLDLPKGDPREGDHVNPKDTLNNTDENLRISDRGGQCRNQTKRHHNTSGFKGVTKNKRGLKWRSSIGVNYTRVFLGDSYSPEAAAEVYDVAAIYYFGEFSNLNFPEKRSEYEKKLPEFARAVEGGSVHVYRRKDRVHGGHDHGKQVGAAAQAK